MIRRFAWPLPHDVTVTLAAAQVLDVTGEDRRLRPQSIGQNPVLKSGLWEVRVAH